jgi:hypothetical protein
MRRPTLSTAAVLAAAIACPAQGPKDAAVVKVEPEAYAAEVKKDEKAAAGKYKGKTIEMTGVVQGVHRNFGGDVFLSLPSKTAGALGVSCFLKDKDVFGKVVKGQRVTVRGRYPDLAIGFQILDCVVTEKGPSPALTYTAADMVAEWAKDRAAAAKKWDGKTVIVSGEVTGTKANDVGAISVYLKAPGGQRVDCGFSAFEKDLAGKIKAGDKVTVVGEFADSESRAEGPALRFCMPASAK